MCEGRALIVPTIVFNLDDGRLVKLVNSGFGVNCHIQDGAKSITGVNVQLIDGEVPIIRFKNKFVFPIPDDKYQEVAMFFSEKKRGDKATKIFAIFASAIIFIPMFIILSMCSKIENEIKLTPSYEGSITSDVALNDAVPLIDPIFENDSDLKKIDRRIKGVIADGDTLVIHFQMLPEDIGGITEALTPAKYISIYANDPIVKSAKKIRFVAFNELGNRFGEFTFAGSIIRQKSFTKMRYDEIADTAENIILTDFGKTSAISWCEDHQSKKICSEN